MPHGTAALWGLGTAGTAQVSRAGQDLAAWSIPTIPARGKAAGEHWGSPSPAWRWAQDETRQGCQPTGRGQEQALWGIPGSGTIPDWPGRAFAAGLGLVMLAQHLVTDTIDISEQKLFCTPKNCSSGCSQEISHHWEIRSNNWVPSC